MSLVILVFGLSFSLVLVFIVFLDSLDFLALQSFCSWFGLGSKVAADAQTTSCVADFFALHFVFAAGSGS